MAEDEELKDAVTRLWQPITILLPPDVVEELKWAELFYQMPIDWIAAMLLRYGIGRNDAFHRKTLRAVEPHK